MAYKPNDLSVLAYANNFTLWHYVTTDNYATLMEGVYFGKAADMLRVNDLIIANTDVDGQPETRFLVVRRNDGNGVVEVKPY